MSDAQLAQDVALDARSFLETLEAVAAGEAGAQAISLLLLDVARICVAGAQLGALTDVVLESNVEPVVPPAPDIDALRHAGRDGPIDREELGHVVQQVRVERVGVCLQALQHRFGLAGQLLPARSQWARGAFRPLV